MKVGKGFGFSALLLCLGGCARVTTTTTLGADGSFKRHVVYTVKEAPGMNGLGGGSANMSDAYKLFTLPSSGVVKGKGTAGDKTYTIDKRFGASHAPVQDITMLTGNGSVFLRSAVTVTKLPNGDVSYDEALKCENPIIGEMTSSGPSRAELKKILPERFRSNSAAIDATTQAIAAPMIGYMFGPPYPHMFEMMGHDDAALMYMSSALLPSILANLAKALPDSTAAERTGLVRRILSESKDLFSPAKQFDPTHGFVGSGSQDSTPGASGAMSFLTNSGSKKDDNINQMTPLLFVVAFKGTVVQTDGIVDPLTGNVFWSLYPMGAFAIGNQPVHLRLVVKPGN